MKQRSDDGHDGLDLRVVDIAHGDLFGGYALSVLAFHCNVVRGGVVGAELVVQVCCVGAWSGH